MRGGVEMNVYLCHSLHTCSCIRVRREAARADGAANMSSTGGGADGRTDWAGDFNCVVCRQKRLTAASFSKRMVERHRREGAPLTCKVCVEAAAAAERTAAASKSAAAAGTSTAGPADGEPASDPVCSACGTAKPASTFTRAQLQKGPSKQRCSECVAAAEAASSSEADVKWETRYKEAKEAARKADAVGSAAEKLKAHSTVAAIEAEKVTGLKPVILGRGGRGRGSWRGAARGRGLSS